MNLPAFSTGGDDPSPPRREIQLQGPRPTPLKIRKESHKIRQESHKIKKPPLPVPPQQARQSRPAPAEIRHREPVIIYSVSPKVIYASESNFMSVVQRLTGPSLSPDDLSPAGNVSPAARLASIEKTSPSEREKERERISNAMEIVEEGVVEISQLQGILSPAPSSQPSIWAGFFSPASDPQNYSTLQDLSPFWQGTSFMPSPSTLFSAPIISPTPQFDLFNHDF